MLTEARTEETFRATGPAAGGGATDAASRTFLLLTAVILLGFVAAVGLVLR